MELIERYLYAVTRRLPANQRTDVAAEIRSTIDDMLAERTGKSKPKAKDVEAVLSELGDPAKLAHEYSGSKQYLIGPRWYSEYVELLKKLLTYIPALVGVLVFSINLLEGDAVAASIVDGFGGAITATIQIFFWTTLGFVIAERSGANVQELHGKSDKASWTPADLPALPAKRQISLGETLSSIAMLLITGVFLIIGFFSNPWSDNNIPVLNPAIWMPWGIAAIAVIALSLLGELWKLQTGKWSRGLAITNVIVNVASVAFIITLFGTQDVINPAFIDEAMRTTSATDLKESVEIGGKVFILAAIAIAVWDSIDGLRKSVAS